MILQVWGIKHSRDWIRLIIYIFMNIYHIILSKYGFGNLNISRINYILNNLLSSYLAFWSTKLQNLWMIISSCTLCSHLKAYRRCILVPCMSSISRNLIPQYFCKLHIYTCQGGYSILFPLFYQSLILFLMVF